MRRRLLMAGMAALLVAPAWAFAESAKNGGRNQRLCASKRAAEPAKRRCTLTGTVVDRCCCVQREGQLYCTRAKTDVETCCCRPTSSDAAQQSADAAPPPADDR